MKRHTVERKNFMTGQWLPCTLRLTDREIYEQNRTARTTKGSDLYRIKQEDESA